MPEPDILLSVDGVAATYSPTIAALPPPLLPAKAGIQEPRAVPERTALGRL